MENHRWQFLSVQFEQTIFDQYTDISLFDHPFFVPFFFSEEGGENMGKSGEEADGQIFFEFIVHGILISSVCVIGFLTNVICLLVMCRKALNRGRGSSVNVVLTSMAGVDIVVLMSSLLMCGLPSIVHYSLYVQHWSNRLIMWLSWSFPITTPYVYPIGLAAQTASVYLTVLVTIERHIAVCWPLRARYLCTQKRARVSVVVVCIFSILYNLSRFGEYSHAKVYFNKEVSEFLLLQSKT